MTLDSVVSELNALRVRVKELEGGAGTTPQANVANAPVPHSAVNNPSNSSSWENEITPLVSYLQTAANHLHGSPSGELASAATLALSEAFITCSTILGKSKPDDLPSGLAPLSAKITACNTLAEDRRSPAFNHAKACAESVGALAFVAYTGPGCGMDIPAQHAESCWQGAQFYSNKILTETSRDPKHVEWVTALRELMQGLVKYLAKNHSTGPVFGRHDSAVVTRGAPLGTPIPAVASIPASLPPQQGGGSTLPPPPPPPPSVATINAALKTSSDNPMGTNSHCSNSAVNNALFSEIRQGTGLKKVDATEKTKHRGDRSGLVPSTVGAGETRAHTGGVPSKAPSHKSTKEEFVPRMELERGQRWVIENFYARGDHPIKLEKKQLETRHSISIRNVHDSTIVVESKVNMISLESCKGVGLLFQGVISSVEAVHCSGIKVQSEGGIPMYQIEQCDGCVIYLTRKNMDAQIVTSLSTEVNIAILPDNVAEEDVQEILVPDQFISTVQKTPDGTCTVETVPVKHAGA